MNPKSDWESICTNSITHLKYDWLSMMDAHEGLYDLYRQRQPFLDIAIETSNSFIQYFIYFS